MPTSAMIRMRRRLLMPTGLRRQTSLCSKPKEQISIRLDREVLEHFRQYPRYQTRINAILRAAMEHEKEMSKTG